MNKLNRAVIRKMRKNADEIAAVLAANSLHPNGRAGIVFNPTACKVLAAGYARLIRNNCKPFVMRITEAEAASLPGYCLTPPGATWWAAFGLDVDQRGTWVSRWAQVAGLPPEEARDAIEVRLLADLARACNVPGLPTEVQI